MESNVSNTSEAKHLDSDVSLALTALRAGGIILYPTDTIWGIGCDASDATAVASIYRLKRRAASKSLIVLVSGMQMLEQYVGHRTALAAEEYACAQRPTTVIYPSAIGLAHGIAATDGSVAIRIARHPFCQALTMALGKAIVSTSANVSGHAQQGLGLMAIEKEIREGVTHIVNERQDTARGVQASRIVRLHDDGTVEIVRP